MRPNKFTQSQRAVNYYHYTPENRIEEIIESGEITLAYPSVQVSHEKACAWVSTNPNWEHTATKGRADAQGNYVHLTFQEHKDWLGCARIQVKPVGLHPWREVVELANMDLVFAKEMEATGRAMGGTYTEWFGSFEPIKSENWIKIEVLKEGQWIPYNPNNAKAKEQGIKFVNVVLPAPNKGEMALLTYAKEEFDQLINAHNSNEGLTFKSQDDIYCMFQESDIYHDIDINPHRVTGVLTEEQYRTLVKPKYDELEAYRKQAK